MEAVTIVAAYNTVKVNLNKTESRPQYGDPNLIHPHHVKELQKEETDLSQSKSPPNLWRGDACRSMEILEESTHENFVAAMLVQNFDKELIDNTQALLY